MLCPGKSANLAVTLMTTGNSNANSVGCFMERLTLNRLLVGSIQCKEYRT